MIVHSLISHKVIQRLFDIHQSWQQMLQKIRLFHQHRLILITASLSNYIIYNVWDEFIDSFPIVNGEAVEIWEWVSNFLLHFTGHVITYAGITFKRCKEKAGL